MRYFSLSCQREIDKCVDKIIGSDPELKKSFDLYVSSLGMMDRQYQDFYGDESQALTYSEHQMEDFYNRAGNILLKHIKEMKNGEFPDTGSDELIKRLSDKGVSGREEKRDNDELRDYLLRNNKYISNYTIANNALDLIKDDDDIKRLESVADISDTAAFALGMYYKDKDKNLSEKYLLMSANNNDRDSQYQLGKLYLADNDIKQGAKWMRRSADNGHAYAQYAYGIMMLKNNSPEEGLYYLNNSYKNGNKIAHKVAQSYKKKLESEETNQNTTNVSNPKTVTNNRGKSIRRTKKAPRLLRSVAASTYNANMCWSQLRSIMAEYDAHIKQLQREFDYENQISNDDYLEYTPYY